MSTPEEERDTRRSGPDGAGEPAARERSGAGEYVREVRSELKRVHWPSRRELASYSVIVLFAVTVLTAYVFGLDQAFGQIVFWIFGS